MLDLSLAFQQTLSTRFSASDNSPDAAFRPPASAMLPTGLDRDRHYNPRRLAHQQTSGLSGIQLQNGDSGQQLYDRAVHETLLALTDGGD
jgi:hypothetical protein